MMSSPDSSSDRFEWTGIELFVCAFLQLILVFLAYRLDQSKSPPIISESAWAIFFGLLLGTILALVSPKEAGKAGLNPEVFFFGLLPPIILEAGFNMKKRGFFANFTTILSLAVVGTMLSTFVVGGILLLVGNLGFITKLTMSEAFLFGSLISAVDPVATISVFKKCNAPPLLFNLVFGESVLNDGVAIVAFGLLQEYVRSGTTEVTTDTAFVIIGKVFGIGLGSILLACLVCSLSAFLLKQADKALQDYPSYEISIVLLSAYLSYVAADIAGLSGIVALFFSGVLMSHYHLYNISSESATALTHLLSTVAFLAENFIFLYLGVSVVAYSGSFTWDWSFIVVTILACLIGRAFNTFPLCALANIGRKEPIPASYMAVIWFSGLRGAIAFALALNVWTPDRVHSGVLKSSTLFTVMFTTLFFGMGTSPLLRYFGLSRESIQQCEDDEGGIEVQLLDSKTYVDDDDSSREKYSEGENSSGESSLKESGAFGKHEGIHGFWEEVDENYLKPVFGGNPRGGQSKSSAGVLSGRS